MVDLLSPFPSQAVLHDWRNKSRDMCCHVCGMVHIKDPLQLIEKSSPFTVGSGVFFSNYLGGPLPYVQRHKTINKCAECVVK